MEVVNRRNVEGRKDGEREEMKGGNMSYLKNKGTCFLTENVLLL